MYFSVKLRALCGLLLGFDHFAAADAGRASADTLSGAIHFGVYGAQVDVPAPAGHVVGVANCISKQRLLAANITNLCHDCSG